MLTTPTSTTLHDPANRAWTFHDELPAEPDRDEAMSEAEWQELRRGYAAQIAAEREYYSREKVSTGLELSPYFVRWLSHRLTKQSAAERLEELRERYPEAWEAYALKKAGKTQQQIADLMGYNQSTISRLLHRATLHMAHGSTNEITGLSAEDRFAVLYEQRPTACEVFLYAQYRWRYDRIAELFDISERTVKRYVAEIRTALGMPVDRRRLKHYIKVA